MSLVYKQFLIKTRTGRVLKRVREHYLRDDIFCGYVECPVCEVPDAITGSLAKIPRLETTLFQDKHYIIIDTNIVLNQIDLLEEPVLENVIILQTVFQETKHRSATIYKRLVDILGQKDRHFYYYENENNKETFLERMPMESPNDYNDRLIRVATKWYNEHLTEAKIAVVLLSDDTDNRRIAENEGLKVASLPTYIESLKQDLRLRLEEKLSKRESYENASTKCLYPRHYTSSEIHAGIKSGQLMQGTFFVSAYNYREANVMLTGQEKSILIKGLKNMNRSIDGDTVVIKLLPKRKWSAPSDLILQDDSKTDDVDELEEDEPLKEAEKKGLLPTGRVVGIVKRNWKPYCGILEPSKYGNRHTFVPANRKIPRIRMESRQGDVLKNKKIVVVIDAWQRTSRYPNGHFVRALGEIGDKETENTVLLLEHDVPHTKFSRKVLDCLPSLPWIITDEDESKRRNLRHLDICSVDPPGCTDIDDALHCIPLPNGNYQVGVHIADVSHFIRPNTPIDDEAALRGTTVYLVDKRIDMVPELLSSNLCSLRENVDRFAFSCVWEITKQARIVKTEFFKSIILSKASLTYEQAQLRIDDRSQNDPITVSLRGLNQLAKILKKRRLQNGALVLSSPEVRFHVDSETHEPLEVQVKKICETNSMVEEFMLLANISVAEKICEEFPECAVLRRHPQPPVTNFDPLVKAVKNHGFEIDVSTGKRLAESLDAIDRPDNHFFNTMIRILATRCMLQAVYFASGTTDKKDYFHYGLAVPLYTHFTSPIRRYADVLVHRLLAVVVDADSTYPKLLNKLVTQKICDNLNYRNRMAQQAGRASAALNSYIFFKGKTIVEDAYILYVRKNALQVLVPKYGLEGTIYLEPPATVNVNDYHYPKFVYNEETETQKSGSVTFRAFDPVKVQMELDSKNIQHEKIIFNMIEPLVIGVKK